MVEGTKLSRDESTKLALWYGVIYSPVTASRRAIETNCRHDKGFTLDPQSGHPNSEATRYIFKYKQPVTDHPSATSTSSVCRDLFRDQPLVVDVGVGFMGLELSCWNAVLEQNVDFFVGTSWGIRSASL